MHWTSTEWSAVLVAVIGAIASAIVSVVNAIQTRKLGRQVQAYHAQSQAQMAALQERP